MKNGKFKKNLNWANPQKLFKCLVDMFEVGASEKGIKVLFECLNNIPEYLYLDE